MIYHMKLLMDGGREICEPLFIVSFSPHRDAYFVEAFALENTCVDVFKKV